MCLDRGVFSGDLQLFQVTFSRAENNDVPCTRADLYRS